MLSRKKFAHIYAEKTLSCCGRLPLKSKLCVEVPSISLVLLGDKLHSSLRASNQLFCFWSWFQDKLGVIDMKTWEGKLLLWKSRSTVAGILQGMLIKVCVLQLFLFKLLCVGWLLVMSLSSEGEQGLQLLSRWRLHIWYFWGFNYLHFLTPLFFACKIYIIKYVMKKIFGMVKDYWLVILPKFVWDREEISWLREKILFCLRRNLHQNPTPLKATETDAQKKDQWITLYDLQSLVCSSPSKWLICHSRPCTST